MKEWSVAPVLVGQRAANLSTFLYMTRPETTLTVHYYFWLLRSGSDVVLVDSGVDPAQAKERGLEGIKDIALALEEHGLRCSSVKHIILTHLHWDHASNLALFPEATLYVQGEELLCLSRPEWKHSAIARYYGPLDDLHRAVAEGRVHLLVGDLDLFPGIRVLVVGGHTPGLQVVAVSTAQGLAVLGSDCIPLALNWTADIPAGITVDLVAAIRGVGRVRELAPLFLYTGHDPEPVLRVG